MARPKARYSRGCLVCKSTLPRAQWRPHKAKGMCGTHHRAWLRTKPQCKDSGCERRIVSKTDSRMGYCRVHDYLLLKEPIRSADAIERTLNKFVSQLEADVELGCWLWAGRLNPKGYSLITVGNNEWLAHRYAFGAFVGGHQPNQTLDHICRRPECVRPDHLMPMTAKRNVEREHGAKVSRQGILADLLLLPSMSAEAMGWAVGRGLPVGRGNPDGSSFLYGLDGVAVPHSQEPANFPKLKAFSKR